jgi:hypothetical protein
MLLLSFAEREGDFGSPILEVQLERHQGESPLLHGADQLLDFPAVQQKLAGADRIVVVAITLLVRGDVHPFQEYLAVLDAGIRLPD